MEEEEKEYNVNCPKGYGEIKFLIIGNKPFCPVSEIYHLSPPSKKV